MGFQEKMYPLKMDGVRFFSRRFAFCPLPSGMDDFSLAKVERPKGDGKYRTTPCYFARQFSESLPVLCQNGYSQNSQTKFLALHLHISALLFQRAKEKSIPYKDMGKKKLTPLEDRTKGISLPQQERANI